MTLLQDLVCGTGVVRCLWCCVCQMCWSGVRGPWTLVCVVLSLLQKCRIGPINSDSVARVGTLYCEVLVSVPKDLKRTLVCRCKWLSHGVVPYEDEFTILQVLRDV